MTDSVEGCSEVQEDEDGEVAGVGGEEEVISDFEQSCFSAVFGTEARLEWFIETVGSKVGLELGGNDTFQDFRQKGEVGYGTEISTAFRVEVGFFENGGDSSQLERLWDRTGGEGGVYDLGDQWRENRKTGFDERRGNGVQGACGSFNAGKKFCQVSRGNGCEVRELLTGWRRIRWSSVGGGKVY